jgi:hypothetical protein
MTLTTTISPKELERVAAGAYESETLKVMLCQVALTGFDENSTVADWQSAELAEANGYTRFSEVIGTGEYNNSTSRYVLPAIDAEFTASGVGYSYDRVVLYIDGATHIHSIIVEDPNVVLAPGQTQTYRLTLTTDD